MAVAAIGTRHGIATMRIYHRRHAHRYALLPVAQVRRAPDHIFEEQFLNASLYRANLDHFLKHIAAGRRVKSFDHRFFTSRITVQLEKACRRLSNASRKRAAISPSMIRWSAETV